VPKVVDEGSTELQPEAEPDAVVKGNLLARDAHAES